MNPYRCGCEDGRDCTKISVCALEAALEDQRSEIEIFIDKLCERIDKDIEYYQKDLLPRS